MKVLIIPEVIDCLEELTAIPYEKGYFGYLEYAHHYVDELIDDIRTNRKSVRCGNSTYPKSAF